MPEEHLFLCGNILRKKPSRAKVYNLQLGKDKHKEQIFLDIETITKKMVQELPDVMHDLLEIATYVYVGDQIVSRGGIKSFDYGFKWHRCLRFIIPVREYETWSDPEVQTLLEHCLSFSSGDTYTFEFVSQTKDNFPKFLNFKSKTKPQSMYDEVLLFSGGLDSFTGVVEEVVANQRHPVLVSHQSNNKLISLQRILYDYLCDMSEIGHKPLHVPVMINKDKRLTHETSQRTRSFLYASLGTIVAHIFNLDSVKFYENGIVSCNLPFDGQTLQARSTRSTHPKLLSLLSEFVSVLTGSDFIFENPFFSKTKTEVCVRLKELHHEPYIRNTRSCAKSTYINPHTHCGTCSQCIDRRFATLASKCKEYDPDFLYALNIFIENLYKHQDRTMAAGFVGFANFIGGITPDSFVRKFSSEVHEIAKYIKTDSTDVALKSLFYLHQRHANSVNGVIDTQLKENVSNIRKGVLPDTCLLSMVAGKKHLQVEQMLKIQKDKPKKHSKGDLDIQVQKQLHLHWSWGAERIAEEIGNTSSDAVRHTKAWKNRQKK